MTFRMYKTFVLFVTNDTNWCGSLNDVLLLIILNEIDYKMESTMGTPNKPTNEIACHIHCST